MQNIYDLVDISGFTHLDSVGKDLDVSQNRNLLDPNGFENLTSVGRGLQINDNDLLYDVEEFAAFYYAKRTCQHS